MAGPDPKKERLMQGPQARGRQSGRKEKKKKEDFPFIEIDPNQKIFVLTDEKQTMAKGGRAGYRMGGKCKLAKKGKGRAYGKNS